MTCKEHPKYELPNTPHAKHRYESAMKHVEAAKAAGKSSEEIYAIFKKVMEFDIKDVENYLLMDRMPNIGVPLSMLKKQLLLVKVAKKRMNYTEKSWLVKQPAVAVIIKIS